MRKLLTLAACGVMALGAAACGSDDNNDSSGSGGGGGGGNLSGTIKIDGSSTVAPFAQAAQEAFQAENPDVKITVGTSGTGGGFEKFCAGETDISDASRPIKPDEEVPLCKKEGIKYDEVQVANDGIAVVTNKNLKVDCLTIAQLKQALEQGLEGQEPERDRPVAAGHDSSRCSVRTPTRARSTSSPTGSTARKASRARTTSRRPTTTCTVQGVTGSDGGLGYFGFSYYEQNKDKLNLVGVGEKRWLEVHRAVDARTIQDGTYKPLSRPLFMYPSEKSLAAA